MGGCRRPRLKGKCEGCGSQHSILIDLISLCPKGHCTGILARARKDAATEESAQAEWVLEGTKALMRFRRTRVKSSMPTDTEQLRHKCRLLGLHWGMLCTRYPNKTWGRDHKPAVFSDHVHWLLGYEVRGLRAVSASREDSVAPSWSVVLHFELTLEQAFKACCASDDLQRKFLVTPLALGGTAHHDGEVCAQFLRELTILPEERRGIKHVQGTRQLLWEFRCAG